MKYTEEQLKFIQSRKPEFIPKPIPSLDAVIVEFLLKYEVYVTPPKNSKAKDGGITGAVAGSLLAGPDLAGDALLIRGQKQQTNIQEWTQWKQWALDHKEFEAFKVEKINDIEKFNDEITKNLKDPIIQKQLEPLVEELRKKNVQRKKLENIVLLFCGGIFFSAFLGIVIYAFIYSQKNKESFINNQESTDVEVIDEQWERDGKWFNP